jgi:hypothetical protein
MGMRARIYPLNSGMLWRRWQPGQGYRADPGVTGLAGAFSGLGDDEVYDTGAVFTADAVADPNTYVDLTNSYNNYQPPIPEENPVIGTMSPEDYATDTGLSYIRDNSGVLWTCADGKCCDPHMTCMLGAPTNPAPTYQAAAAAVNAKDAQSNPAVMTNLVKALSMTATQVANAISSGAIAPKATCPSGYVNTATGVCVPPAAQTGSLIPGVTNGQLATWGAAVFGGLLLITALGKK